MGISGAALVGSIRTFHHRQLWAAVNQETNYVRTCVMSCAIGYDLSVCNSIEVKFGSQ